MLTALIVIIGIIKLSLYYQNFSINIKDFIGFSEIAISVAGNLLFLIFLYFFLKGVELVIKDMRPNFILFGSGDRLNLWYSGLIVITNLGLTIWTLFDKPYYLQIINTSAIFFFFFFTFLQTKFAKEIFDKNKDFLVIIYYFILALINIISITSGEIKSVINGKYKGTIIVTKDTTYISSDTSYYIGQTEKYVFFYHSSKHCEVLPLSNIKRIDIHTN